MHSSLFAFPSTFCGCQPFFSLLAAVLNTTHTHTHKLYAPANHSVYQHNVCLVPNMYLLVLEGYQSQKGTFPKADLVNFSQYKKLEKCVTVSYIYHQVLPLAQLRKASSVQSLERRTEHSTILGEVQIPYGLAPRYTSKPNKVKHMLHCFTYSVYS